jgi:hypothetical protein
MSELLNFPMLSQRDRDINANSDCVPAAIAACMEWLTGQKYTAGQIKDAVYGPSYVGGTAAFEYVWYCKQHGVSLVPLDGNGAALVADLHQVIRANHPALITEPDPYAAGWSHVCAAYREDSGSITVMDPWIAAPVTKSDANWAWQLESNQIWVMEKIMPLPTNWTDDGKTLMAPNHIPVVLGFRDHILQAVAWNGDNWPLEPEYHDSQVILHNPVVGAGQRQVFRDDLLWYTPGQGVIEEPYLGLELDACYKKIAALEAGKPISST